MGTRSARTSVLTGFAETVGHNQDLHYNKYEREQEDNDYV